MDAGNGWEGGPRLGNGSLAVEMLYDRYESRIRAFMSVRLANPETARDLTQEVFVRFLKSMPKASEIRAEVGAYLYGVARHVVADFFSKKDLLRHTDPLERARDLPAAAHDPALDSSALKKCLERLRAVDAEIITRFFWVGEGHQEIARRCGMTHDQVRQRFRRGLVRLKRCLRSFGALFPSRRPHSEQHGGGSS